MTVIARTEAAAKAIRERWFDAAVEFAGDEERVSLALAEAALDAVDHEGAVAALREVRRAALSTAGGDRERCRQGLAEVVEITGRALGGR